MLLARMLLPVLASATCTPAPPLLAMLLAWPAPLPPMLLLLALSESSTPAPVLAKGALPATLVPM